MKKYDRTLKALIITALSVAAVNSVAQPSVSAADTDSASPVPEVSGAASQTLGKAADRKLVRRISAVLSRIKGLDSTRILVRSRDGNVTLFGSVTESSQVTLAGNAAQGVNGVKSVRNFIRIVDQAQ